MRLEQIYNSWLEEKRKRVKPSSMAAYSYLMERHLLPVFAKHESISADELQEFVNKCSNRGLSRNSLNSIMAVLRMVVRHGVKHGWCSPTDITVKLPPHKSIHTLSVFNIKEEAVLIRHLANSKKRLDIALLMTITTGMRIGEVCGLQVGDIMLTHHQCRVQRTVSISYNHESHKTYLAINTPKTGNSLRNVPLHPTVEKFLTRLPAIRKSAQPECYIFTGNGKPLHPDHLRRHYKRVLRQLELPMLRFHALRHTFATRCIESGCDVKTLSSILGHANVQTTFNLYVHPTMEQKQRCLVNMMDYVLGSEDD